MKIIPVFLSYLGASLRQRNLRVVWILLLVFCAMSASYTVLFHLLMEREGQSHSWFSGLYWTIVTMSTLGFGDITFQSNLGRIFSVIVLLTGFAFLLVLLPFTFIQFIFTPWMEMREASRAPRSLPEGTEGHLVLTASGPIEDALIRHADRAGVPHVVLVGDLPEALRLFDSGYQVMLGALDEPETYRNARVKKARIVAATRADTTNTNIAFTVREITTAVPVVATASSPASVDILQLAGANEVLQLGAILGVAMAQRTLRPDGHTHVIGDFHDLKIAEASAAGTSLVGQRLGDARLRGRLGVGVIGVWNRGHFETANADTLVTDATVVILAATGEQLAAYDDYYGSAVTDSRPMLVLGGGRVGREAARAFEAEGLEYFIVEQRRERIRDSGRYIFGDAADLSVLETAGIRVASGVLITTHDDDVNVYLALYCRKLRPDIRIVARANLDRNVSTLYRAGADAVLSYASMGAAAIWNHFRPNDILLVSEGLTLFRRKVPRELEGHTLGASQIRSETGCNVVAIEHGALLHANPDALAVLPAGGDLVLIGDAVAEARFADRYSTRNNARRASPAPPNT
ncbi:MAG TPA: NAD-binding protein [Acidimicrobiales bacterium]|nr:NAD-binding protein [Acidimicrobiales bacterium]